MALTEKVSKEMALDIDGDVIARCKDFGLEVNKKMIDITTLDDADWAKFLPDIKDWKISGSGLVTRGTAGASQIGSEGILASLVGSDTAIAVTMKTTTIGDQYITGNAYLMSYKEDIKVGDAIGYSFELQGSGALSLATVAA